MPPLPIDGAKVRQCAELQTGDLSRIFPFMIRSEVSNPVILSLLFCVLAGGALLLVTGGPALHRAAAAAGYCEAGPAIWLSQAVGGGR